MTSIFIGRKEELDTLELARKKKTSNLVCILGRRRIGKSTLVEEFSKRFKSFVQIQGLSPSTASSNLDQLKHFTGRLNQIFNKKIEVFENWSQAFYKLAELTSTGEHLILLDEISWMGQKDHLFSSRLKDAWDIYFKKNPKLMLILCGSVSSWIEENILKNANFEGRISLEINLEELQLNEIDHFWNQRKLRLSSMEKMLILSITGGVPKYLEELQGQTLVENQICASAFNRNGFLFNEYGRIFTEIFGRKSKSYEKIVRACVNSKMSPSLLAKKLKTSPNSELSEHIHHLILSGFIARDYYYKDDGQQSKLSHLRVKDNYLRFYLKCIEPLKDKIKNKTIFIESLYDLKNFEAILGYQFENLLLANRNLLHKKMQLHPHSIISSSPYVQKKTSKTKGGCQIDLLIHSNLNVFYLCEFKCKKIIDKTIVNEVEKKLRVLKIPKYSAIKPILVYQGELYPPHLSIIENYFFQIVSFDQLILNPV